MLCQVHEHETIIDSGFHVCIKCGLCLEQVFVHQEYQPIQSIQNPKIDDRKEKNSGNQIEFLREMCSKLHIEGIELMNDIVLDYLSLFRQTKDLRPSPKLPDLATLSIYKSLQQRSSISPSILDIASVTKCDLKKVWKLQKSTKHQHHNEETSNNEVDQGQLIQPISAQDIILSKMGFLNLTFADFKIMDEAIKKSVETEADVSARSIAATVMYQYLKYYKKKHCTIKSIAGLFLTTPVSLYRYQSYLKQNNIKLFK